MDCTVVESNIHAQYDSELLVDSIRVLARLLSVIKTELAGIIFSFTDHMRRTKRRNIDILHAKNGDERKSPYRDLINVTENMIGYAENGLKAIGNYTCKSLEEMTAAAWVTTASKIRAISSLEIALGSASGSCMRTLGFMTSSVKTFCFTRYMMKA